jgi:hypothetical protein
MISIRTVFGTARPFDALVRRAERMPIPLRHEIANIMQRGPGSAEAQFQNQGTLYPDGRFERWPKTKVFGERTDGGRFAEGNKDANPYRKSDPGYKAAWLGGSGSVREVGPRAIRIGVDQSKFPQVLFFQSFSEWYVVASKKASKLLRKEFRVRVPAGHVFHHQPRRIDVGLAAVSRAERAIARFVVTGKVEKF